MRCKQFESKRQIHRAIKRGGRWFLKNQSDTFVHYEYDPIKKVHPKGHHTLRELGALWSISELAKFLHSRQYQQLTHKGFTYFEQYFKHNAEHDFLYLNKTPKKIKLGYSAFIILTLLNMEHPKKEEYLRQFARGIQQQQKPSGELKTFFFSDRKSGADYYPGEALWAMISLYEYTHDQQYLEVVQKAFPFYQNYWLKNKNTAFVPWQTRAYEKLYSVTKEPALADFVFTMNDYILAHHTSHITGKLHFTQGIVTAVYLEGVNRAYRLAVELKDQRRAREYKQFIQQTTKYVISLQASGYTKYGVKGVGGFFQSAATKKQRVDRNQHAVLALIETYGQNFL